MSCPQSGAGLDGAYEATMTDEAPATKNDLKALERDLKQWMLEREVASIRWFVGTQLAYVVITLGAMYFMLQRLGVHQ
jgi:hypothetical protein